MPPQSVFDCGGKVIANLKAKKAKSGLIKYTYIHTGGEVTFLIAL